ncbi:MAG: MlaD family protein [Gemmataceae bacterium]
MSRSLSRAQALLLGLVVLAGLALGAWALFQMGDRQRLWAETVELRAGFGSANGIDKGTPVRVRGVEAGQVVRIDLPGEDDPDGKVYLRLRIDKKFLPMLGGDPQVRVLNEGVLGGRVLNIVPGSDKSRRLTDGDEVAVAEPPDMADVMAQAGQAIKEIRDSNGTLSKLLKSDEAHKEVVSLVKDTQALVKQGQDTFRQTQDTIRKGDETLTSLKQDADAIKKLPLIRSYVEDHQAMLYRPDCERDRRAYNVVHLFEPGRAVLTDEGKQHLNNLAPWFASLRIKDSDVVVVAYAEPGPTEQTPAMTLALTQRQAEVVAAYIRDSAKAGRLGWFTSRKVSAVGLGTNPPLAPETEALPPSRVEIQVFWPR